MEKRTLFTNKWLGMALVLPQVLLIFTFFYWPAGQGALLGLHLGAALGRRE